MKKEKNVVQNKKSNKVVKRNWNQILLITLFILLALEIILIPCLVYAEVKRLLPIVFFLILPTLFGIVVLFLSRNCTSDFERKKERLLKKM